MKAKYRCKHCGQELTVTGRRVGGRHVGTPQQRHRDRVIEHLKSRHPDVAEGLLGFTRSKGFAVEDHVTTD